MRSGAPEEKALTLLLSYYRGAHERYLHQCRAIGLWQLGAGIGAIGAAAAYAAHFLMNGINIGLLVFGAALVFPFAFGRIAWLSFAIRRSRRLIQQFKHDLDDVGYHVACDWSSRVERKLVLRPELPTGDRVVTFEAPAIDFAAYDRAFRT